MATIPKGSYVIITDTFICPKQNTTKHFSCEKDLKLFEKRHRKVCDCYLTNLGFHRTNYKGKTTLKNINGEIEKR